MIIVIFGASGDLAKRKLFPSLGKIDLKTTKIIGYSRANLNETFKDKLMEYNHYPEEFLDRIEYISGNYDDLNGLHEYIEEEILFYFSLPPKVYKTLLKELKFFKKGTIAIEKPFGDNLEDFYEIDRFIQENPSFKIYLVDHYLLKPMCIAFPRLKAKNIHFNHLLNDKHVSCIEIISNEQLGIEGRAYFEDTGIVKDILQNHMIEFYCTIFADFKNVELQDEISCERYNVIKNLEVIDHKYIFGQYKNYNNEIGKDSKTETYALFTMNNKVEHLKNTPIILYGGKGLEEKKTEIKISFKSEHFKYIIEEILKGKGQNDEIVLMKHILSVELVFNIAPINAVELHIRLKEKTNKYKIISTEEIKKVTYELWGDLNDHSLIFDAFIKGKDFPATTIEEAKKEWEIFSVYNNKNKKLFYYDKGVETPKDALEIIENIKK